MDPNQLRQLIRELVAQEVTRSLNVPKQTEAETTIADPPALSSPMELQFNERVLTGSDLQNIPPHSVIVLYPQVIISPLVNDIILEKKIRLRYRNESGQPSIAIAADHGGYRLKEVIKRFLVEWNYPFFDFGTDSESPVDYPEFAWKVAKAVSENHYNLGIIIDGMGIGSCMVANKCPGIRAALAYDVDSARNSREHNFANVLTLGGRRLSVEQNREIVKTWLETPYGEERHARRVRMIVEIEKKFLNQ